MALLYRIKTGSLCVGKGSIPLQIVHQDQRSNAGLHLCQPLHTDTLLRVHILNHLHPAAVNRWERFRNTSWLAGNAQSSSAFVEGPCKWDCVVVDLSLSLS